MPGMAPGTRGALVVLVGEWTQERSPRWPLVSSLLSAQFTLGVLCSLFSRPRAGYTPDPSPLFLPLPLAPGGTPETGAKTRGFIKEASRASTGGARPAAVWQLQPDSATCARAPTAFSLCGSA